MLNAIKSVEDQDYKNYEIIVVNDGSTEEEYYKGRFNKSKFIHLEQNQKEIHGYGPGSIRNFGTKQANGKYLAFLDDDDIWLENKLNFQISNGKLNIKMSSTRMYGSGIYDPDKNYELYNREHYFKDLKYKFRKLSILDGLPKIWNYDFSKFIIVLLHPV